MQKGRGDAIFTSQYIQTCDIPVGTFEITPFTLVIFGGTGDLSKRKLLPTLFHIFRENKIPRAFSILGNGSSFSFAFPTASLSSSGTAAASIISRLRWRRRSGPNTGGIQVKSQKRIRTPALRVDRGSVDGRAGRKADGPPWGGEGTMRVGIAADHGGFELKERLVQALQASGAEVVDFGARRLEPEDDYPDFVGPLAWSVAGKEVDRGVAICGSGVGACVAANKVPGVRAAMVTDVFSAHQGVEDDDMNLLCLGGRVLGYSLAWDLVQTFLQARFIGGERHRRRLAKVEALEEKGPRRKIIGDRLYSSAAGGEKILARISKPGRRARWRRERSPK